VLPETGLIEARLNLQMATPCCSSPARVVRILIRCLSLLDVRVTAIGTANVDHANTQRASMTDARPGPLRAHRRAKLGQMRPLCPGKHAGPTAKSPYFRGSLPSRTRREANDSVKLRIPQADDRPAVSHCGLAIAASRCILG